MEFICNKKKLSSIPISKITPEEIIDFSSNISKEELIIACSNCVNKYMKF